MKAKIKTIVSIIACSAFLLVTSTSFAQDNTTTEKKESGSTEYFKGGMKIEKKGDDSIIVHIKKHGFNYDKNHHGCPMFDRKNKYNGHWAGVELGWNGYVNNNFNMTFPADQQYLNLNTARSLMVNLNPIEFNVNLVKKHFGFTSGLGFTLNNYYFSGNYMLIPDSLKLVAYKVVDEKGNNAELCVNKLYESWITIPVLFEYQTNSGIKANSFHVSLGVIGGFKLQSYTKMTFRNGYNMTYYLQDQNGRIISSFNVDNKFIREHAQYHLNPFKLDATMRVGWSFLNLWATYSITPMYLKDQGPKLYPWSFGVTLLGW